MTLREMDVKIAQLLGWTEIEWMPHAPPGAGGQWLGLLPKRPGRPQVVADVPYFTLDWRDAGMLADWLYQIDWVLDVSTSSNGWTVGVSNARQRPIDCTAPTFAEALGRAVVAAMCQER